MTGPTRAERLATPLVREALRQVTADRGGCIRPVQLRRTDTSHRGADHGPGALRLDPGGDLPGLRPPGQGACAPPSAAKAGTWTPNPT